MSLIKHYILAGQVPVHVDLMTWAVWFEDIENRRIARTDISDSIWVSTVFLGLDHGFDEGGAPVLFETMIFGGPQNNELWRCAFYNQALRQHAMAVELARQSVKTA
jgi:hypothetical protein